MSVPEEIVNALMLKAMEDYWSWGEELSEDEERALYEGVVATLELVGPMFEAHALEKLADNVEKADNGLRNLTRDFNGDMFPLYISTDEIREIADNIRNMGSKEDN